MIRALSDVASAVLDALSLLVVRPETFGSTTVDGLQVGQRVTIDGGPATGRVRAFYLTGDDRAAVVTLDGHCARLLYVDDLRRLAPTSRDPAGEPDPRPAAARRGDTYAQRQIRAGLKAGTR